VPSTPRGQVLARAADYALQAPSVDGGGWQIVLHPRHLAIRADGRRRPTDTHRREVVESAGAALFNARVARASGGWAAEVHRLPGDEEEEILADVWPVAGAPDGALAVLGAVASRRRATRRSFRGARVPDDVLHRLTHIAETDGVVLIPIVDEAHRRLVAGLTELPEQSPSEADETADQTMVLLATRTDDELAWLRAGEAMQHVLPELTRLGREGTPLPHPIEVPLSRTRLRGALTWHAHPQMLVRIGHAAPPEGTLSRSGGEVVRGGRG
jgi:hypothetical protein